MAKSLLLAGKGHFRTDDDGFQGRIFASLTLAQEYALTNPKAVPGQILAVVAEAKTVAYIIEFDKTLTEIGGVSGTVNSVNQILPVAGNVSLTAYDIPFDAGNFTDVGAALASLFYVKPTVSLSGGGTYEIGRVITSVSLTWTIGGNKALVSQSFNQGIGNVTPLSLRAYSHTSQSITANRTYTITVNDGINSATASTTVAFSPKRYWGALSQETLSDADILALSSEFFTGKAQTKTFNCTGGKYLWLIWDASYGEGLFTVNGLPNTAFTSIVRNMVNAYGVTSSVRITRGDNLLYGSNYSVGVS